jgi:hypothetical protein
MQGNWVQFGFKTLALAAQGPVCPPVSVASQGKSEAGLKQGMRTGQGKKVKEPQVR